MRGYGWNVFGVIVLTILLLLGFEIVLAIVLSPLDGLASEPRSNIVSGTLTTPFIALVWTLLYFRLRDAKAQPADPAAVTTYASPGMRLPRDACRHADHVRQLRPANP